MDSIMYRILLTKSKGNSKAKVVRLNPGIRMSNFFLFEIKQKVSCLGGE